MDENPTLSGFGLGAGELDAAVLGRAPPPPPPPPLLLLLLPLPLLTPDGRRFAGEMAALPVLTEPPERALSRRPVGTPPPLEEEGMVPTV